MQTNDVVDKLAHQHKQILQVAKELAGMLDTVQTIAVAVKVRTSLNNLKSLLDIHLKVEDKLLYPILRKSPNKQIQDIAITFSHEMGTLAIGVNRYLEKWTTSVYIAAESEDFSKETNALLAVLLKRITREDTELFPLLKTTQ